MSFKKILILGATGTAGTVIVRSLLANKEQFSVIAAATTEGQYEKKKEKFVDLESKGVKIIKIDYHDKATLDVGFKGFDVVLSFLGAPLLTRQIELADIALAAGVQRFYPSELGCDTTSIANMQEKVFQAKVGVAAHLKKLSTENHGFSYTIVVTGALMDFMFSAPDFLGLQVSKKCGHFTGDGNSKFSAISLEDTGKYIVESLLHPELSKNAVLHFEASELTWNQTVSTLEAVQGVKYNVTYESFETTRATEAKAWNNGEIYKASVSALKCVIALGNAKNYDPDNSKFPKVKPQDFKSFAKIGLSS